MQKAGTDPLQGGPGSSSLCQLHMSPHTAPMLPVGGLADGSYCPFMHMPVSLGELALEFTWSQSCAFPWKLTLLRVQLSFAESSLSRKHVCGAPSQQ